MSCRGAINHSTGDADSPAGHWSERTWADAKKPDNILTPTEQGLIAQIEKDCSANAPCPYLKNADRHFYYCARGLPEGITMEMHSSDPVYISHVDVTELQQFCLAGVGGFPKCRVYTGEFRPKATVREE